MLKQSGGSNGATATTTEAEVKEKDKKKSKEQEIDWENVPTMTDELDLAQRHPMGPHFNDLLPEPLRPYPSFEGWFVRIWDPQQNVSAAVILATNYATDESQVTLLLAPGKDVDRQGGRDSVKYGYTYAVAAKTKVVLFSRISCLRIRHLYDFVEIAFKLKFYLLFFYDFFASLRV